MRKFVTMEKKQMELLGPCLLFKYFVKIFKIPRYIESYDTYMKH